MKQPESPTALRPVLGLAALTFFGIAFVGPTAPYTFFGIGSDKSAGHLALVYVIALVAMLFETAFSDIGKLIGGAALFATIFGFVLGQAAISAVASQASASRLLFGMSREGRLPHALFGYIHPRLDTPIYSVLLIGLASAVVPLFMTLDRAAEMVNFGACLGFILVNLSALLRAAREWRRGEGAAWRLLFPLLGLVICAYIWLSLSRLAMQLGAVWCGIGVLWLIVVTRGTLRFRNHHQSPQDS